MESLGERRASASTVGGSCRRPIGRRGSRSARRAGRRRHPDVAEHLYSYIVADSTGMCGETPARRRPRSCHRERFEQLGSAAGSTCGRSSSPKPPRPHRWLGRIRRRRRRKLPSALTRYPPASGNIRREFFKPRSRRIVGGMNPSREYLEGGSMRDPDVTDWPLRRPQCVHRRRPAVRALRDAGRRALDSLVGSRCRLSARCSSATCSARSPTPCPTSRLRVVYASAAPARSSTTSTCCRARARAVARRARRARPRRRRHPRPDEGARRSRAHPRRDGSRDAVRKGPADADGGGPAPAELEPAPGRGRSTGTYAESGGVLGLVPPRVHHRAVSDAAARYLERPRGARRRARRSPSGPPSTWLPAGRSKPSTCARSWSASIPPTAMRAASRHRLSSG